MNKEKTVFDSFVKKLTVTNYYDLDGSLITMNTTPYQDVQVQILEKAVKVMGVSWKENNIMVNDKIIGYNVIAIEGDSNDLLVCVCDDAG